MKIKTLVSLLVFVVSMSVYSHEGENERYNKEQIIKIAMSAGPENVSGDATIISHDGALLREGSNGWVCMPGTPPNENVNPMCVDPAWQKWLQEYMKGAMGQSYEYDPNQATFGMSYMLVGDIPVDNNVPFNTDTSEGVWVAEGPHLMLLLPQDLLKDLPTDPYAGGPYVMWEDTEFVHVMVPLEVTEPIQ
ncbi:MAG: hypothetical protein QF513_02050 [Gammaproteobacteria bacterium]|jgi:hypothetical protein|nr:hypothetical protein [Gammaproteobacteria bacterium]MDP6146562.1 hypothetical protein [Gammaproteobacteria bacterium]HJM09077.1 hypothetical protein [Gammaproteobacteria bacterium]HJN00192.1 hypothetical protein [Gammaproteobacteria bacterium]|tara:strand:- start:35660 stop:36232 length:573 start_codon:yes stop_codon:yes gene_type:complete